MKPNNDFSHLSHEKRLLSAVRYLDKGTKKAFKRLKLLLDDLLADESAIQDEIAALSTIIQSDNGKITSGTLTVAGVWAELRT